MFRKTKVLLCWGSYKTETKHFLGFFFSDLSLDVDG